MRVNGSLYRLGVFGVAVLVATFVVYATVIHAAYTSPIYPSYPERSLTTEITSTNLEKPLVNTHPCGASGSALLTEDEKAWVSCLVQTPVGVSDTWGVVYEPDGTRSRMVMVDSIYYDDEGFAYAGASSLVFNAGSRSIAVVERDDGNTYLGVYYTPLVLSDFEKITIGEEVVYVLHRTPDTTLHVLGLAAHVAPSSLAVSNNRRWLLVAGFRNEDDQRDQQSTLFLVDLQQPSSVQNLGTAVGVVYDNVAYAVSDDGETIVGSVTSALGVYGRLMHKDVTACETTASYNDDASCVVNTEMYTATAGVRFDAIYDLRFIDSTTLRYTAKTTEIDPVTEEVVARFLDATGSVGDIVPSDASDDGAGGSSDDPQTPVERPRLELLAIGDSYISGEGAEHAFNDTSGRSQYRFGTNIYEGNKCHLSEVSYPLIIGKRLYQDRSLYDSVACSGAETKHVVKDVVDGDDRYKNQYGVFKYSEYQDSHSDLLDSITNNFSPGNIAQYHFIEQYKPKRILLSVGGNDMYFAKIVTVCVATPGDDCFDTAVERWSLLKMVYSKEQTLVDTYTKLKEASPDSVIYVTGYPQVVTLEENACGINVQLSRNERDFARQLIDKINLVVESAAARAGVNYVDISSAFRGNELCSSYATAVNGLTQGDDMVIPVNVAGNELFEINLIGNESYHPTAFGHILLAGRISRATDDLSLANPTPENGASLTLSVEDAFVASGEKIPAEPSNFSMFAMTVDPILHAQRQYRVAIDASIMDIEPSTLFAIEYHSTPLKVYEGTVPDNGQIDLTLTVPDLTPGAHEMHFLSTNKLGENVDNMQLVYVPFSDTDYDGDGIVNSNDSLPLIPSASGSNQIMPAVQHLGSNSPSGTTDSLGESTSLYSEVSQGPTATGSAPQDKSADSLSENESSDDVWFVTSVSSVAVVVVIALAWSLWRRKKTDSTQ